MQPLSQARAKQIRLLHQKKHRESEQCFLVEGAKTVAETLASGWEITLLAATENYLQKQARLLKSIENRCFTVTETTLAQLSTYESNDAVVAVVKMKRALSAPDTASDFWLVVDEIRDPGNLGTIIRLADWFGLSAITCVGDMVEWYSPKVIRSSMGSFLRISPIYTDVQSFNSQLDRPLLVADMEGASIYDFQFPQRCALVIGNEARGVSVGLRANSTQISIPRFGEAESLNAAIATGILLNHWRLGLS